MPTLLDDAGALAAEARAFGRYLLGRIPSPELVARYVDANRVLFAGPVEPAEAAVVAFVRRHPWSVHVLDAAVALRRPGSLLRNKVLLMAAILEATPEFADEFLTRPVHPLALVVRAVGLGALAVARTVLGMALYPLAVRSRA